MRTLGYMPDDKQKKIAKETLDIFAPLATRLGIQKMQSELEDLSFYYLDSKDYLELRQAILTGRHDRQQYVLEVINFLSARMAEFGVTCEIEGRPKHLYSVWRKMKEQNLPLKQIYDLVAFRVIVADVQACYNVLGLIHSIFRPIPGRFKDYINLPKKNGYRSLHTAVIGLKNVPMEIQIRTKEMHSYAEEGIAAHWLYKEGGELPEDVSERINSLRTLLNWQDNLEDAEIYLESVRDSLAEHDTVIVITPKGDTKELPVGATPLDFAYSIHSEIGHHCSGARVNGQMTSIRQTLSTGDTVEIITSPAARPSRDWARFVVSSKARARIKQYFATTEKNDAEIFGQELIVREMRRLRLKKTRLSKEVLKKLGFETLNDLNLAVAYSRVTIRQVMEAILPDLVNQTPPPPTEPKAAPKDPKDPKAALDGIFVKGVENVFIHYGHCCSPVPGEPIAGFITRGHGVTIHAAKCASLSRLDPERIVEVSWDPTLVPQTTRKIDLKVQFRPTKGGLSKIVSLLADEVSDLVEVNANNSKAGLLFFKVAVKNYSEYENAVQALTSLGGLVERVDRYYPEDNEAPKDEA
jgi:GTP pyrophosphokinase